MFHPTVQPDELRETARLLRVTNYQIPSEFMDRVTAYPGTPLHREYLTAGYLTSEWPIGLWEFADPEAARVYADIVDRITGAGEITFDEAEAFFFRGLTTGTKSSLTAAVNNASWPGFDQTD